MKIYLVGGAIRDELLGKSVKEHDWVVVGATPEDMIALHFQPVGKDFPVFLHPETHEEYALARTERKTAKGYKGFQFYAAPDVTLKADLKRRDLTINAMAKTAQGKLIDPYNGQSDIKKHLLRHVSIAFAEDPVRILRTARFACQLPNFQVHPDTNQLMQQMVKAGEVDALVAERVWKELSRALAAEQPSRFFQILRACNALSILFPTLTSNTLGFTALEKATRISTDASVRFAALLHPFTQQEIKSLCQRYRVPRDYIALAQLVAKYHTEYHSLNTRDAADILQLLKVTDAFRRPERFLQFITACRAISQTNHDNTKLVLSALRVAKSVDSQPLMQKNLQGEDFAKALRALQITAIEKQLMT